MTAPKPLPPCPICGKPISEWEASTGEWCVACTKSAQKAHEIYVVRPTRRLVRAVWRRLA